MGTALYHFALQRENKSCTYPEIPNLLTYMGSLIWYKQEQLAQSAILIIASLCPTITTTKGGRFLCQALLNMCLPLGVGVQNVRGVKAKIRRLESKRK